MNKSTYFATLPTEEIGSELLAKVDSYNEYLLSSGLINELRDSYKTYYGTSRIGQAGDQGELVQLSVNHYSSLIQSILSMVTSQRPAWESRATNTDVKSQSQTILANGLLDYYAREKRMERYIKTATETSLVLREGWLSVTWNPNDGELAAVDPDTQMPIAEGDVNYKVFRLPDVIRDYNKEDSDHDWLIVRSHKNKHDLAAKYPEYSDRITALEIETTELHKFKIRFDWDNESEDIPIYTFYHRKSESVPNGRMVIFLGHDIVLFDGPLPYRKIPVFKITSSEMLETAFGHSHTFNVLPVQKALDTLFSTVLTNQASFGVQNVLVPKGAGINVTQISGGMNMIEYDKNMGAPTPLNLTQTPPEIFNFINILIDQAQTISGVNAVARGNASPQLSGAAMALLQSTALQFSAGVQQSHVQLVEDVGSATIHLLSDFATTKRVAYIVGKHNRPMVKEFQADDLSAISRVTVDSANALTKTVAGKVELANQLLNAGMIKRPEQYLMVVNTGQLEPMTESETSQLIRIRAENERLSNGQPAKAIITDDHQLDIREHLAVLDSPEARENPAITKAVLDHVQEHLELAKSMPPELVQLLGRQPIMPSSAPGMPPAMDATSPVTQAAQDVNQPGFPTDPLSGQQMNAAGPIPR